jgi:RNA recognition motif-containing protein
MEKTRCFGFVNYRKPECAIEAIRNLNGKMVKDMHLYVGRAKIWLKDKNNSEPSLCAIEVRDSRSLKGSVSI